jgi:Secretion system C-terminal sorting domain
MKIRTKSNSLVCLLWIITISLQAQEVITTSGGYGETSGAKVTWTIGEPITETVTGTSTILTQGFNQGDLIITLIKSTESPGLILKVFPNPAGENLNISSSDPELENLNYILIDMGGKVISRNTIKGIEYNIPVGYLSPNTYFLKIYQNKSEIAIFKIIKK